MKGLIGAWALFLVPIRDLLKWSLSGNAYYTHTHTHTHTHTNTHTKPQTDYITAKSDYRNHRKHKILLISNTNSPKSHQSQPTQRPLAPVVIWVKQQHDAPSPTLTKRINSDPFLQELICTANKKSMEQEYTTDEHCHTFWANCSLRENTRCPTSPITKQAFNFLNFRYGGLGDTQEKKQVTWVQLQIIWSAITRTASQPRNPTPANKKSDGCF